MKQLHLLTIAFLVSAISVGCAGTAPTPVPAAAPAPTNEIFREELDLDSYFHGFTSAFVLYDLKHDRYLRYRPAQCAERLIPASTFKIMNALIGLETGVIPEEDYVIEWDGAQYQIPAWNQDHTLRTAMQNSVVWYYQELARRVGEERMQQYIDATGYGNRDISGEKPFWLNGALRISADEQVEFLKQLYKGDLPFSERSIEIVRDIMVLEKTDQVQLSGKTGSGLMGEAHVGWFVGLVETKHDVYIFATNMQSKSPDANGLTVKEVTLHLLQDLELLP